MSAALKLISFACSKNSTVRAGVLLNKKVLDLSSKSLAKESFWPLESPTTKSLDMQHLIGGGAVSLNALKAIVSNASYAESDLISTSDIVLKAPLPLPRRNVICVGKNYKDHIAEVAAANKANGATDVPNTIPKYPNFFTKAPNCVVATNTEVESHSNITQWLDYEAELAVIIGKSGRDIPREKAMEYVFGYSCANDITSRDIQKHHNQWFKGKSLDTSCPMGPCIVPAADLDPTNLSVKLWINGEKRQDSNTNNMIFDIPEIISQLSRGFTLQPGDVILTGTPDGVGFAMKPPQMLKSGDLMEIEIEGIGRLVNTVV